MSFKARELLVIGAARVQQEQAEKQRQDSRAGTGRMRRSEGVGGKNVTERAQAWVKLGVQLENAFPVR